MVTSLAFASSLIRIQSILCQCWHIYPGLFYGLSAMIGASMALYPIWLPLCFSWFVFLIIPGLSLKKQAVHLRIVMALGIVFVTFFFTHSRYQFPSDKSTPAGIADIEISAITASKTHFGANWNYQATLNTFEGGHDGHFLLASNIPVRLLLPSNQGMERPKADHKYRVRGRLKNNGLHKYSLILQKDVPWHPLGKSYSLAEWRLAAKTHLQHQIQTEISNRHVAAFLSGIATGSFDDLQLTFELGRFGLQHLMAISGLHFSILASFLGAGLCIFFGQRVSALLVILLLSSYFVFLGNSPSVLRAWITITIALGGLLLGKRSQALNSLGIAILVISLWNPFLIQSLGFQLSFAITAAILLWFTPCDLLLEKIFPKRKLSEVVAIGWWDQHGYCLLCFLRQGLALSLAVNLVALPLTLYYFHKFPLMGLVYNLFFPFLVSFSLLFLLLAFLFTPFNLLSQALYLLNEKYTQHLLNLTFNLPKSFDKMWFVSEISNEFILGYLFLVFVVGLLLKQRTATPHDFSASWIL